MTYPVMQIIELMGNGFPLLLNSVLSRTPILVAGVDVEVVDELADSLTLLCPHRHKMIFWRDFTSESEIQSVLDEEKHDYEVVRTVACSLSAEFRAPFGPSHTLHRMDSSCADGDRHTGASRQ